MVALEFQIVMYVDNNIERGMVYINEYLAG